MSCNNIINNTTYLDKINVVTFNCHGYNQGIMELKSLCFTKCYDIIFVQEHWLSYDLLRNFDYFNIDYNVYSSTAMDTTLKRGILRGRPFGGLATLVRKSLCTNFKSINCLASADRYMIVAMDNLMLINVYLPCCQSLSDREELYSTLGRIECEIVDCNSCMYTICGGDMNAQLLESSESSRIINSFMKKLNLVPCNNFLEKPCSFDYTFAVESRNAYSIIDYFYVTNVSSNFVISLDVIHDVNNLSDHLPLKLEISNKIIQLCSSRTNSAKKSSDFSNYNKCSTALDWLNARKQDYYELTRVELASLT